MRKIKMNDLKRCLQRKNRALIPLSVCLANFKAHDPKCRKCRNLTKGQHWPEPWASQIKKESKLNRLDLKVAKNPNIVESVHWENSIELLKDAQNALIAKDLEGKLCLIEDVIVMLRAMQNRSIHKERGK